MANLASRKTGKNVVISTENSTKYWKNANSEEIVCLLCPRTCHIPKDEHGHCFVRANVNGKMELLTYGLTSGLALDPIEKKPLYHFFPGTNVLSFGTAGCNLSCNFCQNWNLSKAQNIHVSSVKASPAEIADKALQAKAVSVAYTYNDPIVFFEFAVDTAYECRQNGIYNVAVTNGFINKKPAREFFNAMDAVNIDLKAFSELFYKKQTDSSLAPVLKTLQYVREQTKTWLEITTLLIPGLNDSQKEIQQMVSWVKQYLGENTPIHFSAFHPSYQLNTTPTTPLATLTSARNIALDKGMNYVYTGNLVYPEGGITHCPSCGKKVIERTGYRTSAQGMQKGKCKFCSQEIAGRFQ
ncbi:MAG: AmmeMemoRadiSam system radical SAM enzyme [Leptospirales bacterium]